MNNRFEKIIEHSNEGLLVANAEGVIELINPRVLKLFGYAQKEDLIGQKVEVLIPQKYNHNHQKYRENYAKKPENRSMGIGKNLNAKRKDGTEFPVEISLSHYVEDGVQKVIAFIVDITKRSRVEAELVRLNNELEKEVQLRTREIEGQNTLLKSIAKNFPNGNIYVLTKDYLIEWADGKLIRELGLDDESLVGLSFKNRLPQAIKDSISEQLERLFKGHTIKFEIEDKGRYFSIYGVTLIVENDVVEKVLLVEMDITAEKNRALEMKLNLQKEIELNEMKSRFVSMASHEFRTPLSTIVSSATLIGKYDKLEQQPKRINHVERIKRSVSNLTTILNDFLSLEKLESGIMVLHPVEINTAHFFDELLEEFNGLKKVNQELNFEYDITPETLEIDASILKNCCLNLLSNASKYSAENGRIDLTVSLANNVFKLEVQDFGIGIPEEEQKQLFSRFFRAKNAINIEGTGLGLNIVQRYVELLQGTISFKSELDKGTTFTINIPM